jgi:hypothetical protein
LCRALLKLSCARHAAGPAPHFPLDPVRNRHGDSDDDHAGDDGGNHHDDHARDVAADAASAVFVVAVVFAIVVVVAVAIVVVVVAVVVVVFWACQLRRPGSTRSPCGAHSAALRLGHAVTLPHAGFG